MGGTLARSAPLHLMLAVAALDMLGVVALEATVDPSNCRVTPGVDINPHTAGLGWTAGSSIEQCCAVCGSPEWWQKGCRFSTLSKGRCWLKSNNATVTRSPGKTSVECLSQGPAPAPPPPPPPLPPKGLTGPWTFLGPFNIGDDIHMNGEAGTLADAASPAANPDFIIAGGSNNGASSGVIRSLDGGRHWTVASRGLFNTRVYAVHVVDNVGTHLLVAVRGAVYESLDGADSWAMVPGSPTFGTCNTFKNGTIDGKPHVLVGCGVGVANAPSGDGKTALTDWRVIPPGGMQHTYLSISDGAVTGRSVIGACLGGVPWIGPIVNRTYANYTVLKNRTGCVMLAMDPNDSDHFIYSTVPAPSFQTFDGGHTFAPILGGMFHVGIDRQGWLYQAAMSGVYVSWDHGKKWSAYYSERVQRRTNRTVVRKAHDYQRVAMDFGGRVAFPSDQGLFVKPEGTALLLASANGNLSNNIAMKVAVSAGDGPGRRHLVTTAWDWGPLASWDSAAHWPSWQHGGGIDDGGSAACIGEGGGAYGMGTSNHVLVMHHHNVMHSSLGGKNMTRFVIPHRATVFAPTYAKKSGSRYEPNGMVYAPVFMSSLPWSQLAGKRVECTSEQVRADLGVQTNFSCLSAVDLGNQYGWYHGVNYAVWRGDTNKHCQMCALPGNASNWTYVEATGAWSYAYSEAIGDANRKDFQNQFDANGDGRIEPADLRATQDVMPHDEDGDDCDERNREICDESKIFGGIQCGVDTRGSSSCPHRRRRDAPSNGPNFLIKNANFGFGWNWTYQLLPPHLQDKGQVGAYVTSPVDGGATVYAIAPNCIARSLDHGDTWSECWEFGHGPLVNFTGTFGWLEIKDNRTMFILRREDVPLRTQDGGATWQPLVSLMAVKRSIHMSYSWSGKTLVMTSGGGTPSAEHPHSAYVWKSVDDGDTWTDETTDEIVTLGAGIGQWYESTLYMNSAGQGIFSKVFE